MSQTASQRKQSPKHKDFRDQRKAPRFDASVISDLKSIGQVKGPEVKLINISRHGALIESCERMFKRSRIALRLVVGDGTYIIKGQITRDNSLSMKGKNMKYQYAIAFKEDFSILHALLR